MIDVMGKSLVELLASFSSLFFFPENSCRSPSIIYTTWILCILSPTSPFFFKLQTNLFIIWTKLWLVCCLLVFQVTWRMFATTGYSWSKLKLFLLPLPLLLFWTVQLSANICCYIIFSILNITINILWLRPSLDYSRWYKPFEHHCLGHYGLFSLIGWLANVIP